MTKALTEPPFAVSTFQAHLYKKYYATSSLLPLVILSIPVIRLWKLPIKPNQHNMQQMRINLLK
jgi:hypothetical protein